MTDPTTTEQLSDERLARIKFLVADGDGTKVERELLAEVIRLRAVETKLRGHLDVIAVAHREGVMAGIQVSETLKQRVVSAERELAELRAMLRPEYGLRYPSSGRGDPDELLGSSNDEVAARLLAAHGDTIMWRSVTGWQELPDA